MFNVLFLWGDILYLLIRYNINDREELICDWGQSDIGIDLGKSIEVGYFI